MKAEAKLLNSSLPVISSRYGYTLHQAPTLKDREPPKPPRRALLFAAELPMFELLLNAPE